MLLSLKNKKIINFNKKNNKIEIKEKNKNITSCEEYIISKISDGKIKINDNDICALQNIIIDEVLKNDLLEQDDNHKTKKLLISFGIFCIILFLVFFISTLFSETFLGQILTVILGFLFIALPILMIFIFSYFISYSQYKTENKYKRSTKGEEINKKLEGLKNYLNDFSLMRKKELDEIVFWEDYLIYSVLFNQNKNIINEIYNNYFIKK